MLTRLALVALLSALATPAWAGLTLTGKPKLDLLCPGNLVNIEGQSRTVAVADDGTTLTFTMPVTSVETGIGLRDSHIHKKFVQADQYPNVVLAIPKSAVTFPPTLGESTTGEVQGQFTLHGTTLPTPVTYTVKRMKDSWKIDAKFDFDAPNHGITEPLSYMGVSFERVMHVAIALELVDAQ